MNTSNNILKKAENFAKSAACEDKVNDSNSYHKHASRVVKLLQEIGVTNEDILVAAMLHGVLKFGTTSTEEITKEFNQEVAYLVQMLEQMSSNKLPSNAINSDDIHKLFIQFADDFRILLIRLADRVDNIKHVKNLSQEKALDIAQKALNIYAPIAHSAGVYLFAREMQNNALKILHPKEYKLIQDFVEDKFISSEPELEKIKDDINSYIKEHNLNHEISYRKKSAYSIYSKVLRKNDGKIDVDGFKKIRDLIGIRVIVDNSDDCYKLLAHIQDKWKMLPEEYDDYILNPKPNGYQTLQTSFELTPDIHCELQLRTFEMHDRNEYGKASHFGYKYSGSAKKDAKWIKQLIEIKNSVFSNLECDTKIGLFKDTIFVFTPKQDLITLPKNATAIDFAYAVHTEIGNKCMGIKINSKISKLNTVLNSGDILEVLTSKSAKPNLDWLQFAKTKEARDSIKSALKIKDSGNTNANRNV